MSTNIFTISQPYHFLIAKCYCKTLRNKKNIFYVLSNSTLIKKLNDLLNEVDSNIKIIYFKDCRSRIYEKNNVILQISNIRFLKKDLRNRAIDSLYVFNDFRPDAKAAIHFFKKYNIKGKIIILDEGMPLYCDIDWSPKYSMYKIIIFKLIYGLWWKESRRIGETKNIDKYIVFHPDKVNKNIPTSAIEKIDINIYNGLNILNTLPSKKIDIFLLLDNNSFEYKSEIDSIIQYCLRKKIKTSIKLHPIIEQLNINWKDYFFYDNIEYLETVVPIELYFQKNKQNKYFVLSIGTFSTPLCSSKLFNPEVSTAILFKPELWSDEEINLSHDLTNKFDSNILYTLSDFYDFYEKN